jgi:hypothetical protein
MYTLTTELSFATLRRERSYTHARLLAHPATQSLAPSFAELLTELDRIEARANTLVEALAVADAGVDVADYNLDAFFDRFVHMVLTITNNQRNAFYHRFLLRQSPSRFKRPVLGKQLEAMRSWPDTIQEVNFQQLKDLLPELTQLIKAADEAIAQGRKAEQTLNDFYQIGEMPKLIDRFNALRNDTLGKLNALRHSQTQGRFPTDFAEQFFLRNTRRSVTLHEVERTIVTLDKELARNQAILEALKAEETAEQQAKEEAERQQTQAEIAEVEQTIRAEEERLAALRAKLGEKMSALQQGETA